MTSIPSANPPTFQLTLPSGLVLVCRNLAHLADVVEVLRTVANHPTVANEIGAQLTELHRECHSLEEDNQRLTSLHRDACAELERCRRQVTEWTHDAQDAHRRVAELERQLARATPPPRRRPARRRTE